MVRPVSVATAAPVTPKRGNGPSPKIRHGSISRLIEFEIQSTRMAMAASPAPRKTALFSIKSTTTQQPPRVMRAYLVPAATTAGDAPIRRKR